MLHNAPLPEHSVDQKLAWYTHHITVTHPGHTYERIRVLESPNVEIERVEMMNEPTNLN